MTKLLLGERSNKNPGEGDLNKILASPTRKRLDMCYPQWEKAYVTRNIWADRTDDTDGKARLAEILYEVRPSIIVALGITVSLLLDVPYDTPWLDTVAINGIPILKFPHPSGKSRLWNDDAFAAKAAHRFAEIGSAADTVVAPKTTKVTATRNAAEPEVHVVSEPRLMKRDKTWSAFCQMCSWSVEAPRQDQVASQAAWHESDVSWRKHHAKMQRQKEKISK